MDYTTEMEELMKRSEFDKKIKEINHVTGGTIDHSSISDAAIFVNDTLDIAWASAKSVFGNDATPDIAVLIYDRIIERKQLIDLQFELDKEILSE
jgi:hypothetical protein